MKNYTVMDLFAGAGGLSLGFERKGFNVVLAIEKDAWAVDTYITNHKNKNIAEADITTLENSFFQKYAGKVDAIVGGPPCQGFSIAASNRRKIDDSRNFLYKHYLRVVEVVNPKIILIENVKEIVKYKLPDGNLLIDDIKQTLSSLGYVYDFGIINCREYGIPQDRKRFFLIGINQKIINKDLNIIEALTQYKSPELTLGDAISDLPEVKPKEYKEDSVLKYTREPKNYYQQEMRGSSDALLNHIPMQHTDKTVEKFKFMLSSRGEELPEELRPKTRGDVTQISNSKFGQNHRILDDKKVSPTITASFYSSFVHPEQPRNLTVREAARIQSFPDTFIFKGKKTTLSKKLLSKKGIYDELHLDQFNQVGNAVPPKMAGHLAEICLKILEGR